MKEYSYDKKFFNIQVTLTGIFSILIAIGCLIGIILGQPPALLTLAIIAAVYTAWNDFISNSNPEKVIIADDYISFSSFGREDKYMFDQLESFKLREFPSAGKIFIRVNNAGIFKGRYWVHTRNFSDGKELFMRLIDMEYNIHPDSLKAKARRVNTEYIEKAKLPNDIA